MNLISELKKNGFVSSAYHKMQTGYYSFLTLLSPKLNTKVRYRHIFGKKLDLENPVTLNEKILWLKLNRYMKDPLVIQCADKYAVREYIEQCGCGEILNKRIGAWDRAEDIPWEKLPSKFVLKWNFGAGMNIICSDKSKLDKAETIKRLKKWGKSKYWLPHSEMQYKYAPKKIVCEEYLNDGRGLLPQDYKVYCFHGKAKYVMLCIGREYGCPKFYYFDRDMKFTRLSADALDVSEELTIPNPECVERVFQYAEKLSEPFPFVRADFFVVEDRIYFGELTFSPSAGLDGARLPETDLLLGSLLNLENTGLSNSNS